MNNAMDNKTRETLVGGGVRARAATAARADLPNIPPAANVKGGGNFPLSASWILGNKLLVRSLDGFERERAN